MVMGLGWFAVCHHRRAIYIGDGKRNMSNGNLLQKGVPLKHTQKKGSNCSHGKLNNDLKNVGAKVAPRLTNDQNYLGLLLDILHLKMPWK